MTQPPHFRMERRFFWQQHRKLLLWSYQKKVWQALGFNIQNYSTLKSSLLLFLTHSCSRAVASKLTSHWHDTHKKSKPQNANLAPQAVNFFLWLDVGVGRESYWSAMNQLNQTKTIFLLLQFFGSLKPQIANFSILMCGPWGRGCMLNLTQPCQWCRN